ncbi:MAG: large subunit ribosomal protein L31 [Marinomonas primoryensis]
MLGAAIAHLYRPSGGTPNFKVNTMKNDIHPTYSALVATCTCGNTLNLNSTAGKDMHLDVCSNCHPFYTGQQKMLDSGGRVDRFNKRFGARRTAK